MEAVSIKLNEQNNFLMSSILPMLPGVHQKSTRANAHHLANALVSNRLTRPSHRVLFSLYKRSHASVPHKSRGNVHSKKNDKGLRNKLPQRRSTSKKCKVGILSRLSKKHSWSIDGHSSKQLTKRTNADGKVLRSTPTGCFGARLKGDLYSS